MDNGIWLDWLEETPEAAYGAFRPRGGAPSFTNYWQGQQGRVWNDYMGQLGQMALGGNAPVTYWSDYLKSYPFQQKWAEMSPRQRGERPGLFNRRLRWDV